MAKAYGPASEDVTNRIAQLREDYHLALDGVEIQALFVFVDEPEPCLKHQGYAAHAVAKIVSTENRAAGMPDALIIIDRYVWEHLESRQKNALLDHELYHFERVIDEETERPKYDVLGRPKLAMRLHDRQLGWFDEIAQRHGDYSMEVMQAKQLISEAQQLYFDFGAKREREAA